MKNTIYKITITKWNDHNFSKKNTYKKTMISNNMINDAKINALPMSNKWLFLSLLLICGDHAKDTIMLTERQINDILTTREGAINALERLQSFQLLTFEKMPLIKEINKINKEINKINTNDLSSEKKTDEKEVPEKKASKKSKQDSEDNKKIWDEYFSAYRLRYGVEPVKNVTVNSKISNLRKRLGVDEAMKVVKFYLNHNDGFYLKSTHSIGLCLRDCESLRTQMLRGKTITNTTVRQFEKIQSTQETLDFIDKHGI